MKIIKTACHKQVRDVAREYLEDTKDDWNYITPEELKKNLDDFYILDIRKPEDFAEGHIPNAKNIFWLDLLDEENLAKLPRDKKIVLVCYVGHTASQMLAVLKMLGFDVISLKFGMGKSPVEGVPVAGWLDYGFEIEKGTKNENS